MAEEKTAAAVAGVAERKVHPFFKKMRAGEMINSQAKQVILNVFFQLSSLNPQKTYTAVGKEASLLTGVSYQTIFKLKAEKQKTVLFGSYENNEPTPEKNQNQQELHDVLAAEDANCAPNQGGAAPANQTPAKPKRTKKEPKRPVSPRLNRKKPTITVVHVRKKRLDTYDEAILTGIRLKFHNHVNPPTIGEFFKEITADEHLPNFSRVTFHRLMKDMGLLELCKRPARLMGQARLGKKPAEAPTQGEPNYNPQQPQQHPPQPPPAPQKGPAAKQRVNAANKNHNHNQNPNLNNQNPNQMNVNLNAQKPPTYQHQHQHQQVGLQQNRLQLPMHHPPNVSDYRIPRPYM